MMANLIPQQIIEEVLQQTDIVEVVSRYVTLKRTGRNLLGLCPFHNEKTASFSVTPDKQIYYCFGCHKGGNAISFLMEIEQLSFYEAVEKLAAERGIALPQKELSQDEQIKIKEKQTMFRLHQLAAEFYERQLWDKQAGREARRYLLEKRGLSEKIVKKFGLGYAIDSWDDLVNYLVASGFNERQLEKAGLAGTSPKNRDRYYNKFRNRIIFPIMDYKGQVIAFGGRTMGDETPKYLNSTETPIYNKSQNLYGLYQASQAIRKEDQAVIMEGYMDVIAAHQHGVNNAIASLGTALTKDQARLLKRYTNKVLLAYDGDDAGIKATIRGIEILTAQGFQVRMLVLPAGFDPDDFLQAEGKGGWDELVLNGSKSTLEYKLELAIAKYDNTVAGKGAIVKELLPDIAKNESQVERDVFVQLLASRLGVAKETVYADLRKSGLQLASPPAGQSKIFGTAVPSATNSQQKIARDLVLYMLQDENIFKEIEKTLGLDFPQEKNLQELLSLVKNLNKDYLWQPASLISCLADNKEAEKMLLNMLANESHAEDKLGMARACAASLQIFGLQQKIEDIQKKLANIETNNKAKELLAELGHLQQQIRELRQ